MLTGTYHESNSIFYRGHFASFGALWSNKLRTFLTMVGVATGIFAITSILTMTYSMQYSVTANLSALGNTTMFVHNWPWKDNSEDWFKFFNRPKVSYKDYEVLHKNLKEVVGVAYNASIMGQSVKTEGRSLTGVAVQAVTEDYGKIGEWNFAEGRYFSDWEIGAGSPVCVLGYNLGQSLFPNQKSIIGKWVRVSGRKLKVIGIRSKQGSGMFGPTPDDQLFIPYLLATKEFDLSRRSVDKVITLKAVNYEKVDYVESEAIGLIRAARGLKPSIENNFSINKQEMLMKQIDGFFGYM
ncbi:MAG: ABC transporter permease, partial [Bacteroidia bacterium]